MPQRCLCVLQVGAAEPYPLVHSELLLAHRLHSCVNTLLCLRIYPLLKSSGWSDGLYCGSSVPHECSKHTSLQLLVERPSGTARAGVIQPCHPQAQSCRTRDVIPFPMGGPAIQGPYILTYDQFASLTEAGSIYEAGNCCFSDLNSEREMHPVGCCAKW